MSKKLFEMMKAEEMASLYPHNFTKKEAQQTGKDLVNQVLELGNVSTLDFGANLVRLSEVIGSAMTEFRSKIKDMCTFCNRIVNSMEKFFNIISCYTLAHSF